MNLKVEPYPACDSTQILPPLCSMIFLQMARPMPLPGYSVRACRRWKATKIVFRVLRRNSDSVIADAEPPALVRLFSLHGNQRRIFPAELDGVPDQILENLRHLRAVRPDDRKLVMGDDGSALLNGRRPESAEHPSSPHCNRRSR